MRFRDDPTPRLLVGATALSLALVGGGALGAAPDAGVRAVGPAPTTVPPTVTCPNASGQTSALIDCLADSIVYIESGYGTGSGVQLPTGEIITNAHVVGAGTSVDVVRAGDDRRHRVEVLARSFTDDLALLAAPPFTSTGIELADELSVAAGADVFLVGYPGGWEADVPEPTITHGILSRVRPVDTFGQTWLQTDAAIVGGQSGGALVDADGRLLGISGYSDGNEFAFALAVDRVAEVVAQLRDDPEPGWTADVTAAAGEVEIEFPERYSDVVVYIPSATESRTARLTSLGFSMVDDPLRVVAISLMSGTIGGHGYEDDPDEWTDYRVVLGGIWFEEINEPQPWKIPLEVDDRDVLIDLPADEDVALLLSRDSAGTLDIDLDVPFALLPDSAESEPIELGDTIQGEIDLYRGMVTHSIALEEDTEILVTVSGTPTSVGFTLLTPTQDLPDAGDPGLRYVGWSLGFLDGPSQRRFRIKRSGDYHVAVVSGAGAGYELTVEDVTDDH